MGTNKERKLFADPVYASAQPREKHAFQPEAEEAILQMGANAIPALLERLVYVDSVDGLRDPEINAQAQLAFGVLGDRAKSALPKLVAIMEGSDEGNAYNAMHTIISICGTNSESVPFFLKGLTNQHAIVRNMAVTVLMQEGDAEFRLKRKQALPILLKLLEDTNEVVKLNARSALKTIDPEAAGKARVGMSKDK